MLWAIQEEQNNSGLKTKKQEIKQIEIDIYHRGKANQMLQAVREERCSFAM